MTARHARQVAGESGSLRVAVATCAAVPALDADGPVLVAALEDAGLAVQAEVWDNAAVNWQDYDLVLVRSTWDYTLRRDEFLVWAATCPAIANPASVLRWNTDKRYLQDLQAAGIPTVPSVYFAPGQPFQVPAEWTSDVVVKPTVSASAADTGRYASGSPGAVRLLERLHADGRAVMAQPYLPAIESEGETSLIFLGGQFSHAVRRRALLTARGTRDPVVGDAARAGLQPATAYAAQLKIAMAALDAVPREGGGSNDLAYARVDLIPGPGGEPRLLELELVEPSLFLDYASAATLAQLANAAALIAQGAHA